MVPLNWLDADRTGAEARDSVSGSHPGLGMDGAAAGGRPHSPTPRSRVRTRC